MPASKPMELVAVFGVTVWVNVLRRYNDNAVVLSLKWGYGRSSHSFDIPFNGAEALEFIGRFTAVTQECITAEEANGKADQTKG